MFNAYEIIDIYLHFVKYSINMGHIIFILVLTSILILSYKIDYTYDSQKLGFDKVFGALI